MTGPRKPRLIFQATIRRKPYLRRGAWSVLATVAAIGAVVALDAGAARGQVDPTLRQIGMLVGLIAAGLFALRALISLWQGLRRRDEELRFFDKGFVWKRGKDQAKYGWSQVDVYREGGGGLYLGKRPLVQWGGYTLKMADGRVFKVTGRYGDLREFGKLTRRYPAAFTGTRMAQTLRDEQPVKVHRRLTLWPGGIEIGRQEIPWSELDLRVRGGRLVVLRKAAHGKFRVVRRYNIKNIDNVGGLMEVAISTIRNHQRERFEKREPVR
ncbi:MAG TPA: hypothetical protein VHO69_12210 [Phototrophicaceae bacterium]|nr:hypothetical protein [Phototrophicaceae bacterium]